MIEEASASRSLFSRLMELAAVAHGAVVNLHDVADVTVQVPDLHLKAEQHVHHGSYCRFAKFTDSNRECARNKLKSVGLAQERNRAFWGCCPFGVWDLAQPLKHEGKLLAVLYLGHFQGDRSLLPVRGKEYSGPALPKIGPAKIRELKKAAMLLEENFRLIVRDWSRKHGELGISRSQPFYRSATLRFIESRYSENVNLQDLARDLNVHPHYLGKMISRAFNESFKSLLRRRRLDEAKLRLRSSDSAITQIAFECGFQDSNYFSAVFHRSEGTTPKKYRSLKMGREEEGGSVV